jgi:hypothetical protein
LEQHFWQQACFCVALQGLLKSHGVTGPQILKFDQSTPQLQLFGECPEVSRSGLQSASKNRRKIINQCWNSFRGFESEYGDGG